jgi:hypothetical protein
MASQQYGLGRGLASLIPPKKTGTTPNGAGTSPFVINPISQGGQTHEAPVATEAPIPTSTTPSGLTEIPVGSIVPNPHQPRLHFDEVKFSFWVARTLKNAKAKGENVTLEQLYKEYGRS